MDIKEKLYKCKNDLLKIREHELQKQKIERSTSMLEVVNNYDNLNRNYKIKTRTICKKHENRLLKAKNYIDIVHIIEDIRNKK